MTFTAVKKWKFFNMESEQITTPEPEQKTEQNFFVFTFLLPILTLPRIGKDPGVNLCEYKMRYLYMQCGQYAEDHSNHYPDSLETLLRTGDLEDQRSLPQLIPLPFM